MADLRVRSCLSSKKSSDGGSDAINSEILCEAVRDDSLEVKPKDLVAARSGALSEERLTGAEGFGDSGKIDERETEAFDEARVD